MKNPYLLLEIHDDHDIRSEIEKKQNEFLDVYSLYLKTKFSWIRDELRLKAYELHLLNPQFNFPVEKMA